MCGSRRMLPRTAFSASRFRGGWRSRISEVTGGLRGLAAFRSTVAIERILPDAVAARRCWGLATHAAFPARPQPPDAASLRSRLALLTGRLAFAFAGGFAIRLTFGLGFGGRLGFADARDDPDFQLTF